MESHWSIILSGGRPSKAARLSPSGEVLEEVSPVWTLAELRARSGKSRRQIYRDLADGKIRALGKFLGEWLVTPSQLLALDPPPASCASLFPEYEMSELDPDRDRDAILSRILRFGGRDRLRWALSFYGEDSIEDFVVRSGARTLDARSLRLWCLYFGVKAAPSAREKSGGKRWGGGS
jgi:hypothetical protein